MPFQNITTPLCLSDQGRRRSLPHNILKFHISMHKIFGDNKSIRVFTPSGNVKYVCTTEAILHEKENIWYSRRREASGKVWQRRNSSRKYSITRRVTANITWIETSNANMPSFPLCQSIYLFRLEAAYRNLTIPPNVLSGTEGFENLDCSIF